ncbi:MAG: hypothetical protein CSA55_01230 [Ilumatobacter coccineus]|uniref:VWFA domain-containing protein n=1 Tax=Ilumatobacter coccineus TaxID=467094 RepID=A0A2G6KFT8_9ACTN|nr:MAG: hypothetical protein CSA55_01230 [Ilumatobacter coccineus]
MTTLFPSSFSLRSSWRVLVASSVLAASIVVSPLDTRTAGADPGDHSDLSESPVPPTTVPEQDPVDVPTTTLSASTIPEPTVPDTSAPVATSVPDSTVPRTTLPETTVPLNMAAAETVPETTVPLNMAAAETVPETTVPVPAPGMPRECSYMTPEELEHHDILCEPLRAAMRSSVNPSEIDNPPLAPSCAIDVVLIVDESGSMRGNQDNVRNALRAILDSFNNTGSNMAIVRFDSYAHQVSGFVPVDDSTTAATGVLGSYIDDYEVRNMTNWDDALHAAHTISPPPADGAVELTMIITDGNPNARENHNHPGYNAVTPVGRAINEADHIKGLGSHMFAVGVGNNISETNLQRITGDVRFPTAGQTFGNSDYMIEPNFDDLETSLRAAVYAQCAPEVIIKKRVDLDGDGTYETSSGNQVSGFEFIGTISGATENVDWTRPDVADNTSPVSVTTGTSGSAHFEWRFGSEVDPQPGSLTMDVVETQRPGYTYQGAECTIKNLMPDGNLDTTVESFAASESVSFLVEQGTIVTCDFNNRAETVVVLQKEWVDSMAGDTAVLAIAESGGLMSSDTSTAPDAPSVDLGDPDADPTDLDPDNSAELVVATGASVTLSEALSATSLYDRVLTCDKGSLDYTDGETTGTLDTSGLGGETVTCTFTNTRTSASLDVVKAWDNAVGGDQATLVANYSNGSTNLDVTAPNQASMTLEILSGETVTVTELFNSANVGNYDISTVSCVDDAGDPVGTVNVTSGSSFTYQVPAVIANATCTVTNRRDSGPVTLHKAWENAASGDAAELHIDVVGETSASSTVAGDPNLDDTANQATADVNVGDSFTIYEDVTETTGAYGTTYRCASPDGTNVQEGAVTRVGDRVTSGTLTMPDTKGLECVFTNSRRSVRLKVDKEWVGAALDDTAAITASGESGIAGPKVSVADSANETDSVVVALTVFAGETGVSVAETLGAANAAAYSTTLSCPGVDNLVWSAADLEGTFDIPKDVTDDLTCTLINTAQRGTIVIKKTVVGSGGDFTFDSDWNDSGGAVVSQFVLSPGDDSTVSQTWTDVLAGSYEVSERVSAAYGQTVTCSESGATVDHGSSAAGLTGSIDLDPGETVTCTYTNVEQAHIVVVKDAQPNSGQAFDYSLSGGDLNETFSLVDDSAVPATNTWQATVSPGVAYTLVEELVDDWDLDSVTCTNGVATTPVQQADAEGVSFTPTPGQTVVCTFVNKAVGSGLSVTKKVADVAADYDWSFEISLTPDPSGASPVNVSGTGPGSDAATFGGLVLNQQYTIAEVDPGDGWSASEMMCTAEGAAHADEDPIADGYQITITQPAMRIECELTNQASDGSIKVTKSVKNHSGDWSFDFTLSDDDAATADQTFTLDQDNTVYEFDRLVSGESYTLTETVPDGWSSSMTCTVTSAGGGVTTSAGPWTIEPGDSIECDVVNERKTATMTVAKVWLNAAHGDGATLTAVSETGTHTYLDSSPAGAADSMSFVVRAGETVSLSEVLPGSNAGSYAATALTCVGDTGTLTWTLGELEADYEVTDDPQDITCTWTNTRNMFPVALAKTWNDPASTDDVTLTAVGAESAVGIDLSVYDGTNAVSGTTEFWAGETIDLVETLAAGNLANYTTSLECRAASGATIGDPIGVLSYVPGELTGKLALPKELPTGYDRVVCTWTNVRDVNQASLTKRWVGALAGDQVDLSLSTDGHSATSSSAADGNAEFIDTAHTASLSVGGGETVSFGETVDPNNAASYTTTWECSSDAWPAPITGTGLTGDVVMPASASVACVITNTATTTTLHVDKVWINAVAGDTAKITVDGTKVAVGPATATADSDNLAAPGETDTDVVTVAITSGETGIAVSETVNSAAAIYDQVLSCTGVDNFDSATGTFDIPKNPTTEPRCTLTNTAQRGTIVVVKTVDGAGGDFTFDSDWNDSSGTAVDQFVLSPPDAGTVNQTWTDVLVGQYSVSELTNAAYDQTVTCSESGATVDHGSSVSGVTGSIDLDPGETVTCAYTNTERATLVVIKDAQPDDGQAFEYSLTGGTVNETFSLTDDGVAPVTNTWSTTVSPDLEYTLVEGLTAHWTLESVSCDSSTTPVQEIGAEGISLTPDAGQTVTCTFVNDADESELKVTKSVAHVAADYGWSFEISLTPDPSGASPVTVSGTGPSSDTATFGGLVLNQEYTIAEVDPGDGWSASEMMCTVQGAAHADEDPTLDGYQITIAEAASTIECELTNTATSGQLELTKSVVDVADDLDWSFAFEWAIGDPVTSTAAFSVDKAQPTHTVTDLLPGETYTLSEVVPAGWTVDMACTVTSADGMTATSSGPWTIQPGDSIDCDVTNTADLGAVTVTKSVVGDNQQPWEFSFTIDPAPVGGEATQTISGTGPATEEIRWNGLVPGVEYTISEADAGTRWVSTDEGCVVVPVDGGAPRSIDQAGDGFIVAPGDRIDCGFTNTARGDVAVDKSVAQVATLSDGKVKIVYTIVVTNNSTFSEPYELGDTLQFGAGIMVTSAQATSTDAAVNPTWDGVGNTQVTAGEQVLAPGAAHTFTVVVEAVVAATSTAESRNCVVSVGETGTGLLNSAQVAYDNGSTSDDACGESPPPPRVLPRTGSETAPLLGIGLAAMLAGWFLILISRRRRREA